MPLYQTRDEKSPRGEEKLETGKNQSTIRQSYDPRRKSKMTMQDPKSFVSQIQLIKIGGDIPIIWVIS